MSLSISETKERILSSDEFILEETHRMQTLYGLKSVIRYHQLREEEIDTESVAEHVYGMHALAAYFLPLENPEGTWDRNRITLMIQFHDVDEIETGDIIGYMKTPEQVKNEHEAQVRLVAKLPESMQPLVEDVLNEYDAQETLEARFTKAIDKIEPTFHLLNENGKQVCRLHNQTHEQHRSIKDKYVAYFPCIKRFNEVTAAFMVREGFFAAGQNDHATIGA